MDNAQDSKVMGNNGGVFELHYFLENGSHSIDTKAKHRCESELLSIVKYISELLEESILIESQPPGTGGYLEFFGFIATNPFAATLIANLLVELLKKALSSDKEMATFQKESIKLTIQKQKLELRSMKRNDVKTFDYVKMVDILSRDIRILRHKSEFYRTLKTTPKITSVSARHISKSTSQELRTMTVSRPEFEQYIIDMADLPLMHDDNAVISIISPVLTQGKYPWRGIYHGGIIDFSIKDKDFRESVVSQQITFKNGTTINCILEANRKVDEFGIEYLSGYKVITVNSYTEGEIQIETESGKRHRKNIKEDNCQMKLFGIDK
jgi:hypothetical protein